MTLCASNTSFAWAFYFFDGRDSRKQQNVHEILIRSLIRQLWDRCHGEIPSVLVNLYKQFDNGGRQPPIESLQDTFLAITHGFDRVFVIIDALDECHFRVEFLRWLGGIAERKGGKLHLAVTGRPERDIVDIIRLLDRREVCVDADSENIDIRTYLDHQLLYDPKLNRWPEKDRARVKDDLTKGADGM
jgi:hypothetical protein